MGSKLILGLCYQFINPKNRYKTYSVQILIELIEILSDVAVHIVPPVADEDGLVSNSPSLTATAPKR